MARILLKARPTKEQLADRLSPPWADGLEFYLDARDIQSDDWLEKLENIHSRFPVPEGFEYVVEGPLRSLDGAFFDITRGASADDEVIARLVRFGQMVGARAAVIHCIAPSYEMLGHDEKARTRLLGAGLPFLERYATICQAADLVPTIENIPPIARMRESRFMYSAIGMEPADLLYYTDRVNGLKLTIDLSHAQLYLNAAGNCRATDADRLDNQVELLCAGLRARREVENLHEYLERVIPLVFEVHVSNAAGLLDEGLSYGRGDLDLDPFIAYLLPRVACIVTETLEPDQNRAVYMREAQQRIGAVRESMDAQPDGLGRGEGEVLRHVR